MSGSSSGAASPTPDKDKEQRENSSCGEDSHEAEKSKEEEQKQESLEKSRCQEGANHVIPGTDSCWIPHFRAPLFCDVSGRIQVAIMQARRRKK